MKRGLIVLFAVAFAFLAVSFASAGQCNLTTSILQQDPYPAVPGEYVKVVFQVDGIANPICNDVIFSVIDSYPFSLESGEQREIALNSGGYVKDYGTFAVVPYKLRVDSNALDGDNKITIKYYKQGSNYSAISKDFNINVRNPLPTFDVFVNDYSYDTGILSLSILNIGKTDAKTVTLQIPGQDNVLVIGNDQEIIGDMDSQSDELASYNVNLMSDSFDVVIKYTDESYVRRTETLNVKFNPDNFKRNVPAKKPMSATSGFIIGVILVLVILFGLKRYKKYKQRRRDLILRNKR